MSAHLDPNWSHIAMRWTSEDANAFLNGLVMLIAIEEVDIAITVKIVFV